MKFLSHDGLLYFWRKIKSYIDTKYNELFQSVSNGKTLVASAITDKGIVTDATDTFATMADNILLIETGTDTSDATAVIADVLNTKTFYANNEKLTGTMVNNGAVTSSLNAGGSYTIPKGYHNGSGKVTANSLASQTSGTATAGQILSGKTAFVNGNKITGTIVDYGITNILTDTILVQDSNVYFNIPNSGYYGATSDIYTTQSKLAAAIGLTADKIVAGNTILGIAGTGYGKWG